MTDVVLPSLALGRNEWDPDLHPRDERGRFDEGGNTVIASSRFAPVALVPSIWLGDFEESKHPRDSHGRFGDKAADGGVLGVGELQPQPTSLPPWVKSGVAGRVEPSPALNRATDDWQYYNSCANTRYAAECMLGQDHPTVPDFSTLAQTTGNYSVLQALADGKFNGDQNQETQSAVNDAHALLAGIRDAPVSDLPLFRGMPLDPKEPGTAALQALKPGDTFDLSLASFSNDRNTAESFAVGKIGEPKIMLTLADGGKGVSNANSEMEVHVGGTVINSGPKIGGYDGGSWERGHADVVVGGRLEVVAVRPYVPESVDPQPSKYTTEVVVRQVGVFDPDHGGTLIPTRVAAAVAASARPATDYQRPAFWREFGPTPDRKKGTAPSLTAGGFDESEHPRGPGGKFAPKDDAEAKDAGTTYVTRFGPDVPAGGDPAVTDHMLHEATTFGPADPYPHAEDIANYAAVPFDDDGEMLPPPEHWEPGSVFALSEAATYWQESFANSRGVQAAADELLGYKQGETRSRYEGEPSPREAGMARELLNAMADNGPEGAASAFSLSSDYSADRAGTIGLSEYGPTELARGMDDKDGSMREAFQHALDTNGTVEWSLASFVQGGDAGALRMETLASESGEPAPGAYDEETGDFIDQHPDDNAAQTALQYTSGTGTNNVGGQPEAPMLIRTSGQALTLDGGWEALAGGTFAVDEMRTATPQELDAWNAHGFHEPITVVQLRQVENVKLPPGVPIPSAA